MKPARASPLPHLGFWAALACVAAMGWILHGQTVRLQQSSEWVEHTHEALAAIGAIDEQLSRAESTHRGYLLSREAAFLVERDQALIALQSAASNLVALIADNDTQRARGLELKRSVERRAEMMRRDVPASAESAESLGAGAVASAEARRISDEMRQAERRLLDARRDAEQAVHRNIGWMLLASAALALLIIVPSFLAFGLESRKRRRIEGTLREMAGNVPGAIYRCRATSQGDIRFEYLSPGITRLTGIDRAAALRDPALLWNAVVADDQPGLARAYAHARENLAPLQHEFRIATRAGEARWIRSSAAPSDSGRGAVVWNGHAADITAQKALEHDLDAARHAADAASRAKSTFLAVMSHEVRTPMNGVLGMLELLSLTRLDADQRRTLGIVRESGRSLQRIIDDILDFSKIEAGKLDIALQPASVSAVVENTRNMYSGNASSKGLVLKCSVAPDVSPALVVDPLRLGQVLNNMTSNAIKFTNEGEVSIDVSVARREGELETLRFEVRDTGIGMPTEVQTRLFRPFSQAHRNTAATFGGTGLGLSISKRLAEMMGGSIEVRSAPGAGTTMLLTLPLRIADARDLPQPVADAEGVPHAAASALMRPAPSIEQAERDGSLVLIVDDHPTNRILLSRQTNVLGYAAETAANGLEALDKWKSGRFGLIVTDCNMPEMDGYELTRLIRRLETVRGPARTPVIACTANALRGEAEKCFAAGMDDYLSKPVQVPQLADKLRQWLPLPDAHGQPRSPGGAERVDAQHAGDVSPIDPSVLAQTSRGDTALERDILSSFLAAVAQDMAELDAARARRDYTAAKRSAHRMKGAAGMVGAVTFAGHARAAEQASGSADAGAVAAALDSLVHERERLERYLAGLETEPI